MKYFSMFSGIGGFELGISRAFPEAECVGYSEIDKFASRTYERHFHGHTNFGDASTIDAHRLPDFDLLVGGFPCQSFSIAGTRGGFDDTRGTLFFEIARVLGVKKPRLCVLENVKGLLSHDRGRTFDTIIRTLDELGYDCQWQVLDSEDWGVPQNRERIYIVGHLRGTTRPQVFPLTPPSAREPAVDIPSAQREGHRLEQPA
jgi:DNA (cytosine-5)-methyltransferase 1